MGVPIIVVLILSTIGFGLAYGIRKKFRKSRLLLTPVLAGLLVPWFMHHNRYLREAEYALQEHNDSIPLYIRLAAPFLVLLVIAIVILFVSYIGRLIAVVPILSFYITLKVTYPLVTNVAPPFNFDNMPTWWLAFWSIAATVFLLVYAWPLSSTTKR